MDIISVLSLIAPEAIKEVGNQLKRKNTSEQTVILLAKILEKHYALEGALLKAVDNDQAEHERIMEMVKDGNNKLDSLMDRSILTHV